ncbi:MAG TPA: ferredoxin, partial [Nitrososphaeria archaeon]|nr:ferredoxin [Nitrososphaeria archaeon]
MSAKSDVKKVLKGEFTYKTLPMSAMILSPPTSPEYKTGTWRVKKPVIDQSKCIRCLLCWVYCPDMAIMRLE